MRADLVSFAPWFEEEKRILCPICFRPLLYNDFSVEHIKPRQVVAMDPKEARESISRNERSGMTLLCRKPLLIDGKIIYNDGCNSWKGKHYDPFLRDVFHKNILAGNFSSRHHIAIVCISYLGLFLQYGYQVSLLPSGLVLRTQFFNPNRFIKKFPLDCQMVLTGDNSPVYSEDNKKYWSNPFDCSIIEKRALMRIRNFIQPLPISRDPNVPIAFSLPYAPSRYKLRPDLHTAFD